MLNDDTVRLSMIGQLMRRRWALLVGYAIVGGLIGGGAAVLFAPGYESRSSVLLQGPLGEDELATQALIGTSSVVLDRTAASLGGDIDGEGLRGAVGAEVLSGNVIALTASAQTAQRAQRLNEALTRQYVGYSRELVAQARGGMRQLLGSLGEQLSRINERLDSVAGAGSDAQPDTELSRLRTALTQTTTGLEDIAGNEGGAAFGRASIVVLEPADLPASPTAPTLPHFIAGGAALLVLLGLFGHLVSERANRKPRSEDEIAAALGYPVLGTVDVANESGTAGKSAGTDAAPRRWLRVRHRIPASAGPDSGVQRDSEVRYQRILARLRGGRNRNLRLLIVVADDDMTAHHAVAGLAVAASTSRAPTLVVTDDAGFARIVHGVAQDAAAAHPRVTVAPSSDPEPAGHRTVLRVVRVGAERPTVPENTRDRGAMLALTAGTRTAWELIGIAEACTDAGHELAGALVAYRARPSGGRAEVPVDIDPNHASPNGTAKAVTP